MKQRVPYTVDMELVDTDSDVYYECPTCDLYVRKDDYPVHLSYEDGDPTYDYPMGRVVKWYYLPHYYVDVEGEMFRVPVFSDGIFTFKLACLHQTVWEAEAAVGEEI